VSKSFRKVPTIFVFGDYTEGSTGSVAARGAVVTGYGVAQLGDSINQLIDFGVQISDVAGAQRDRPHPWNFRARHEGVGCIVEPVVRAKFGSAAA